MNKVKIILYSMTVGLVVLLSGCISLGLPDIRNLDTLNLKEATEVFDSNNQLIAKLYEENRIVIPLSKMPVSLQQAIIAVEDSRFYSHIGVDPVAVVRAFYVNIIARSVTEGGSTLTQQLAKNLFFTQERTIGRKFKELLMALTLERKFSKQEILEAYLNQVYLGEGVYGVEAAAQLYFGKHALQLTLPESALLAGLPRGPSIYSPYVDKEAARQRRNIVLQRMKEVGFIDDIQYQQAVNTPIQVAGKKPRVVQASYFLDYVAQQLVEKYGANQVYRGGMKVYTTLDLKLQQAAESALDKNQGAVLAIDPKNGYIKAMVGGRNYQESQMNRALTEIRQPGSAFKPFTYAVALGQGLPMNTVLVDESVQFGNWKPVNYDNKYHGKVIMKKAIAESINIPAIKLLNQVGVDPVLRLARDLGISTLTEEDKNLAIALGGLYKGVNLLELTAAYTAFANQGIYAKPISILRVVDENGGELEKTAPVTKPVLSQEIAYLLTYMLQETVTSGTGKGANIGRPVAGKTGTTDNYETAWFIGYTPSLVVGIYVGNDDRTAVNLSGTQVAGLWGKMMSKALAGVQTEDFSIPADIVTNIPVCTNSGQWAGEGCNEMMYTAYIRGTEPYYTTPPASQQPHDQRRNKLPFSLPQLPRLPWQE